MFTDTDILHLALSFFLPFYNAEAFVVFDRKFKHIQRRFQLILHEVLQITMLES